MPGRARGAEAAPTVLPGIQALVQLPEEVLAAIGSHAPALRRALAGVLDVAVRDIMQAVVERSVTIACVTSKELVVKDMATEPAKGRLEGGAQLMVAHLAGSLALVTCTEPLRSSLSKLVDSTLAGLLGSGTNPQHMAALTSSLADSLLAAGRLLVERAAMRCAARDVDQRLARAYAARDEHAAARSGKPFADPAVFPPGSSWAAMLPPALQPRAGGLDQQQLRVYQAFGTMSPWSAAAKAPAVAAGGAQGTPRPGVVVGAPGAGGAAGRDAAAPAASPEHAITAAEAREQYLALMNKLTAGVRGALSQNAATTLASLPEDHEVPRLLADIAEVAPRVHAAQRDAAGASFVRGLWSQLLEMREDSLALQALLAMLSSLNQAVPLVTKELTSFFNALPAERMPSPVVLLGLLRTEPALVSRPEVDEHLARLLGDSAAHGRALPLVSHLLHVLVVEEGALPPTTFRTTIDALVLLARASSSAAALAPLTFLRPVATTLAAALGGSRPSSADIEAARRELAAALRASPGAAPGTVVSAVTGVVDPEQVRRQVLYLLEQWVQVCAETTAGGASKEAYAQYLLLLTQAGVLSNEASTERFLRIMMELCVQSCNATAQPYPAGTAPATAGTAPRNKLQYTGVDAMCKLIVLLVKVADSVVSKVTTLSTILAVVVRTLLQDCALNSGTDTAAGAFDPRPYFRLLSDLLSDLHFGEGVAAGDSTALAFEVQSLAAIANVLHALRPQAVPAFAWCWQALVSHRLLLPRLLALPNKAGWPHLHRLLTDMLRFLWPYQFLCDYHFSLCCEIHPSAMQLRNLALSAYPAGMQLPDPFRAGTSIASFPACSVTPKLP
ncbi:cnot1, partial [Symbiodinium sp. KB8]